MNIIYIIIDTLRADHLSCYGYFRKTSPNIDKLADDGVLFLNCYSEFPYTLPSFTSHITGICGIGTGIVVNAWRKLNERYIVLDDRIPTLAEVLFHNGYVTVAVDNMINFGYHPKWFVRGYQYYINPRPRPPYTSDDMLYDDIVKNTDMVLADEVNYHVIKWLESHGDKKFFLFIHYWDPHTPYNMPKEFTDNFYDEFYYKPPTIKLPTGVEYIPGWGRLSDLTEKRKEFVRLYDCEVYYVDTRIGEIINKLKEMGIYDDTLIVVTSDHGELMFEHHYALSKERIEFGHGLLYNEVLHVPLVLKLPSQRFKGKKVEHFVQTIDIFPTLLELADVKREFTVDGISLLSLIEGKSDCVRELVVGTYVAKNFVARSIMTKDWKYVVYSPFDAELYDIARDPYELNNLAKERVEKVSELHELLKNVIKGYVHKWNKPDPFEVPELLDWRLSKETAWKVKPTGERPDK